MKTKRRKQPPMIYFSAEHYEMMRAENRPRVFVAVLNYRPAMKAVELRRNWTQEAPMYGQDIEGS